MKRSIAAPGPEVIFALYGSTVTRGRKLLGIEAVRDKLYVPGTLSVSRLSDLSLKLTFFLFSNLQKDEFLHVLGVGGSHRTKALSYTLLTGPTRPLSGQLAFLLSMVLVLFVGRLPAPGRSSF